MKPTVLIIDDDSRRLQDDPLVWSLQDEFGKDNVILMEDPAKALDYITNNISLDLIVLLDIQFPGMRLDGNEVLKRIRQHSELIPVVVFTGTPENETFADFVNNHAFAFIDKDAANNELLPVLRKAKEYYKSSLDNVIEDWIENQEGDKDKPIYFTANGTSLTLNQILAEIRKQTAIGKEFSRKLTELTIDLLIRNKRDLNG